METRTLIIIRHAAALPGCSSSDRLRDLSEDGRQQARVLGAKLSAGLLEPLAAFISPANRTVQTWQVLSAAAGLPAAVIDGADHLDDIYWGWADEILDTVRGTPGDVRTAIIVGHEPTVTTLAAMIAQPGLDVPHGMPTGSAVVLSADQEWSDWGQATATSAVFLR